jgi:hypothetical protein
MDSKWGNTAGSCQQKIDQSFRKNMERGTASETLKAMDHEVWVFGKATCEDRAYSPSATHTPR